MVAFGMMGGGGGDGQYSRPPPNDYIEPGIPVSEHVNSELTLVGDGHGWIEVDPNLVWHNPDTYTWIGYEIVEIDDNFVMVYYFEFSG